MPNACVYDPQGRADLYKLSAHWFRKASERALPTLYFWPLLTCRFMSCEEAFKSLDKAISLSYTPAITAMGQLFYMDGRCGKNDYGKGLQLLRKAAEGGDAEGVLPLPESRMNRDVESWPTKLRRQNGFLRAPKRVTLLPKIAWVSTSPRELWTRKNVEESG